ncbi:MAG TPA: molybdenum cofactor guanylyltransferase MobA [Pseudomonadales bacterium]|nr:molybdenum cofactor guanylyltransferase [Gammaproteobacteria bacterium]MDP6026044.1 molybdenum cofactor guanylyltransferase MobA [Pseudomonadales bacterium]MDP6316978.1 molybdenum cofactor guanylyltransferase MobA [Pseudomonadales bacterium]MDP7313901.1 molybdenum cofactor guanylyltransferase MobA [Pseudomonadales bacterium]HJP53084.1 molybdenum cofactor guanylyltransferase MobA [Pseudomonadales bacterium]|tara:strand:+ start:1516 stop:2103 length:588 start_codon:yes stop_codon:yes gene_type:complete
MTRSGSKVNQPDSICAIILSGGRGQRMSYQDKGLILLEGKPLIQHVLERIEAQVDQIVISCNRNIKQYEEFGFPVVTDVLPDSPGPLTGVLSAKSEVTTPLVFIVPCDMPYIPTDVVRRLYDSLNGSLAVTASVDGMLEPLISLVRTDCINSIGDSLRSENRSVRGWLEKLGGTTALLADEQGAFRNVNSPQDLT